jgi:hypothetical protein
MATARGGRCWVPGAKFRSLFGGRWCYETLAFLREGVGVMESADGEEGQTRKGSRTGRLTAGFDGVVGVVVSFLVLVRCRRRSCTG